ncbi:MAG: ATP-dependent 6-phosphofructokinase [Actinomycetota bacterium]|jgi:6-phosphofructokinase 1|nr:ATP-dependent 6-phosphofructokinase [Actinomycetota bacterium]MDA8294224.1 ATP-dependent 6-phosphofructokinase [Actinomycetota bacterium]
MRVGLLTGGGDCPGLNAAIRAVVRVATRDGNEVVGFHHGWRGVVDGEASLLSWETTRGILGSGGTVLRTARYHPHEHVGGLDAVVRTVRHERLDALVVVGGDGTLGAAARVADLGVPVVGIPKTIDNDVPGTTRCIGFDTAVGIAAEAVDRLETTGESHDRLMVAEVMGRTTGWLAVEAGIAGGANAVCLPEVPTDLDALAAAIVDRHDTGTSSSVVVVAEGAALVVDGEPVIGGRGAAVAEALAKRTGFETRLTVLGHVQRGGPPSAYDRFLATQYGVAAVAAVHAGAACHLLSVGAEGTELVPLGVTSTGPRRVPRSLLDLVDQMTIG